MTSQQFDAVAKLIRMRQGRAEQAAYWVLVDGMRPADAARKAGITPASVSDATTRIKSGMALAQAATGLRTPK